MSDADLRTELEALVERMLHVVATTPRQDMVQFFAFEIKRLLAATAPPPWGSDVS